MTPLRSKLEEIISHANSCECMKDHQYSADQIIQAITELIEEAQPEKKQRLESPRSFGDGDIVNVSSGYNQAIDEYKSNLLKGVRG